MQTNKIVNSKKSGKNVTKTTYKRAVEQNSCLSSPQCKQRPLAPVCTGDISRSTLPYVTTATQRSLELERFKDTSKTLEPPNFVTVNLTANASMAVTTVKVKAENVMKYAMNIMTTNKKTAQNGKEKKQVARRPEEDTLTNKVVNSKKPGKWATKKAAKRAVEQNVCLSLLQCKQGPLAPASTGNISRSSIPCVNTTILSVSSLLKNYKDTSKTLAPQNSAMATVTSAINNAEVPVKVKADAGKNAMKVVTTNKKTASNVKREDQVAKRLEEDMQINAVVNAGNNTTKKAAKKAVEKNACLLSPQCKQRTLASVCTSDINRSPLPCANTTSLSVSSLLENYKDTSSKTPVLTSYASVTIMGDASNIQATIKVKADAGKYAMKVVTTDKKTTLNGKEEEQVARRPEEDMPTNEVVNSKKAAKRAVEQNSCLSLHIKSQKIPRLNFNHI